MCQHYFNEIGGIETFLINFCKKFYKKYDITLLCRDISVTNALIISQYAEVVCNPIDVIECDTCIITSVLIDDIVKKFVKFKEVYQMIHSDWTKMKKFWDLQYEPTFENTKFISVSETARESFIKEFGYDSIVIPNLLDDEDIDTRKPLRLLTLARLTKEKGYERMVQLCKYFEKYDIPYIWNVYGTNVFGEKPYGNMYIHSPRANIKELIKSSDYLVQLSDTESFCYSMYEALQYEVPVLVTPFPNAEQEIINGENGYILPFDMKLNKKAIENIYKKIPTEAKYKQVGVEELWEKML